MVNEYVNHRVIGQNRHKHYLEQLIHHLDYVDEYPKDIALICSEGFYLPYGGTNQNSLNDLILFYYDKSVSLIELKGSTSKRTKAIKQLQSGFELVTEVMGYDNVRGKIVYYHPRHNYTFENIILH